MVSNRGEVMGVCPVCRKGHLVAKEHVRVYQPHGKPVEVRLQTSVCDACGESTTKASQHKANLRALAERKAHYGDVLMGEEILALRKRYGLTQQQASRVFGKGKIAFSRYESETTYPDESTTLLLTLAIERREVMKSLADKAGVELPLWKERCEDEQRVKVRSLTSMGTGTPTRQHGRVPVRVPSLTPDLRRDPAFSAHFSGSWLVSACDHVFHGDQLQKVA